VEVNKEAVLPKHQDKHEMAAATTVQYHTRKSKMSRATRHIRNSRRRQCQPEYEEEQDKPMLRDLQGKEKVVPPGGKEHTATVYLCRSKTRPC